MVGVVGWGGQGFGGGDTRCPVGAGLIDSDGVGHVDLDESQPLPSMSSGGGVQGRQTGARGAHCGSLVE